MKPNSQAGRRMVEFFRNLNEGDQFTLAEFACAIEEESFRVGQEDGLRQVRDALTDKIPGFRWHVVVAGTGVRD